jgi:hypothetical protein
LRDALHQQRVVHGARALRRYVERRARLFLTQGVAKSLGLGRRRASS